MTTPVGLMLALLIARLCIRLFAPVRDCDRPFEEAAAAGRSPPAVHYSAGASHEATSGWRPSIVSDAT